MKHRSFICTIVVIVILFVLYLVFNHFFLYTRIAYLNANTVVIAPQVSGKVEKIWVRDLQHVEKGQLLLTINDASYQQEVAKEQAELTQVTTKYMQLTAKLAQQNDALKRVKSQFDFMQKEYTRYRTLLLQQAVSKEKVDQVYTGYVQSKKNFDIASSIVRTDKRVIGRSIEDYAPYQVAKARLALAMINEKHTKLYSPVTGYVSAFLLKSGTFVSIGKPLLSLVDTSSWWVTANVLETYLDGIQAGREARVCIPAVGGKCFVAKIYGIAWGVDRHDSTLLSSNSFFPYIPRKVDWIQLSQRFPVRLDLHDVPANAGLRVGASAHVFLRLHYERR